MNKYVGTLDRVVRIILALVAGYLYFSGTVSGTGGVVLLIVGIALLATGLIGWCGLYTILGISTIKKE